MWEGRAVQSLDVPDLRLHVEMPEVGFVSLGAGLEQFFWGHLRRFHGLVVADIYAMLHQGRQHEFILPGVLGGYVHLRFYSLPFYAFLAIAHYPKLRNIYIHVFVFNCACARLSFVNYAGWRGHSAGTCAPLGPGFTPGMRIVQCSSFWSF